MISSGSQFYLLFKKSNSFFRFVNLVSRGFGNVQTWQHVKSIRKEYYRNNSVEKCSGFVSDEDINHHFKSLSLLLGINNVTSKIESLSEKDISTGAEMFVYLNSCPSYWVYVLLS